MPINAMIKLRAAQNHLLAEYPKTTAKCGLDKQIQSEALQKRLCQYRNVLHQKFVVFHLSETVASIEAEMSASKVLAADLTRSRDAYADTYVKFATVLGDAAAQGANGNYFSMLANSAKAVVDFVRSDSALRNELHCELVQKVESGAVSKLQEFVDGDASVDAYLSALREDHFYFQSEIERLYRSGQIQQQDFQQAIAISSAWKEEIVTAIIKLRDHQFQRFAQLSRENNQVQVVPHRDLALRLVSEFLISPPKTGKVGGVAELGNLKSKFLNARRDVHIADAINRDVGVKTEAAVQQRSLAVGQNSLQLKAIVATLKRHVLSNAKALLADNDEALLQLLSNQVGLLFKTDLSEDERLQLFADYYYNKVERMAYSDELLEKKVLPGFSFLEMPDDKGQALFESLRYLGRDLLSDQGDTSDVVQMSRYLLALQDKIQTVLDYYFINFKKLLLASKAVNISDEKKIDLFVLNYMNQALRASEASQFYHAYFSGVVQFKAALPQPHQIILREDSHRPGHIKVEFLGGAFAALSGAKAQWAKVRACTLFGRTKLVSQSDVGVTAKMHQG